MNPRKEDDLDYLWEDDGQPDEWKEWQDFSSDDDICTWLNEEER